MMMENNIAAARIPMTNAVEGFDPAAFTREINNEDGTTGAYLDVKYRLLWFRLRYPNGKVTTEIHSVTDHDAVVSCKIYCDKQDPVDQYIARSVAQRFATQDKYGDRYLELAETAAIGRALAVAGFGTQFCSQADIPQEIADAPVINSALDGNDGGNNLSHQPQMMTTPPVAPQRVSAPVMQQPAPTPAGYVQQAQQPVQVPQNTGRPNGGMSIQQAEQVTVDFGRYKGFTLGQIAMVSPGDLQWYVDHYSGSNLDIKAGAMVLLNAARAS